MEKKKLWLALSALSASVGVSAAEQGPEKAGITSSVQPQAEVEGKASRVLFVGSDIFRNEVIRTDEKGLTHLLFLDKSSLTIGPNSLVTIDRYVYNPKTDSGELAITATRGILRFVGGSLSKKKPVTIKTPLGTLGIRGGGILARIEANLVQAYLFYGDVLTGASSISNVKKTVVKLEHGLELYPDGRIVNVKLQQQDLDSIIEGLTGPAKFTEFSEVPLPGTFKDWRNIINNQENFSSLKEVEQNFNFSPSS